MEKNYTQESIIDIENDIYESLNDTGYSNIPDNVTFKVTVEIVEKW